MRYAGHMSVAEIKEQMRQMYALDVADIGQFAVELLRKAEPVSVREVSPTDLDVPAAMDEIFEKHRELLRRLAQ
jgi:hypothetical protein